MTTLKYDIILPIAKEDFHTACISLPYIKKYLKPDSIVIIGCKEIKEKLEKEYKYLPVNFVDEDNIVDGLGFTRIKEKLHSLGVDTRVGWYFQQFIKMAYAFVTNNEYYISWDADMIPLRNIEFFNGKAPYFTLKKEYNKSYFDTIKRLLDLDKVIEYSFISEHMVFSRDIMKKMILDIEQKHNKVWYDAIIDSINPFDLAASGFSEFETYGTYTFINYPQKYEMRKMNTIRYGKCIFGECPNDTVLNWLGQCFDTISFEKWDKRLIYNELYEDRYIRRYLSPRIYIKLCSIYIKIFKNRR